MNPAWSAHAQEYVELEIRLLKRLDITALESAVRLIEEAYQQRRTIVCAGNGGSAATASHFAADLAWGRRQGITAPPRVMSLAVNVPMLTAVGNDAGYHEVFVEQMRGLFQAGDLLIALSASGHSENILRAIQFAHEQGGHSIGLVGFDGGPMKHRCTVCLHVETEPGAYEVVEDIHHAVCHMMTGFVKRRGAVRDASLMRAVQ